MNEILHAAGARLIKLRKKLAARENTPGYEKNCEALRAEIARLEGTTLPPANLTTSTENAEIERANAEAIEIMHDTFSDSDGDDGA